MSDVVTCTVCCGDYATTPHRDCEIFLDIAGADPFERMFRSIREFLATQHSIALNASFNAVPKKQWTSKGIRVIGTSESKGKKVSGPRLRTGNRPGLPKGRRLRTKAP